MKKQLLITYCSTLLFLGFQSIAMADKVNEENTSMQNNMNMMQGNSGMGMMNGRNCMGMRNRQNRMGMMNSQNHMGMMKGGCMNMSMQRHRFVMQNGIKPEYQNKVNPIKTMTPAILSSGKALYESNCAACHGTEGQGMGMFPQLAGKSSDYIIGGLTTYKNRGQVGMNSSMMWGQAANLSEKDIETIGKYVEAGFPE